MFCQLSVGADSSLKCVDRPVAAGSASGIASTLILSFLRNLVQDQVFEAPALQLPIKCSQFDLAIEDIPWWTFLAGLVCGILLGPLIDLVSLAPLKWRGLVLRAFARDQRVSQKPPRDSQRSLHKVVA